MIATIIGRAIVTRPAAGTTAKSQGYNVSSPELAWQPNQPPDQLTLLFREGHWSDRQMTATYMWMFCQSDEADRACHPALQIRDLQRRSDLRGLLRNTQTAGGGSACTHVVFHHQLSMNSSQVECMAMEDTHMR